MFTLKADNRVLTQNSKYSYLGDNFLSGVAQLTVTNSEGFLENDYVLLGEFGSETTEILKISSVTEATHALNFTSSTKWSHAESTKVAVVKYNQAKFYRTVLPIFDASVANEVTDFIDIQPDSFFTLAYDLDHTTGYGWFILHNQAIATQTQSSNYIPYAGFEPNTVKAILDDFFSTLNNKELKLISEAEAIGWLNEGYSILLNELNVINKNFATELEYEVTTTSGLAEYSFPDNFGKVISIWSGTEYLDAISTGTVSKNNADATTASYYTRGGYLGFSPKPIEANTYKVTYTAKTGQLKLYSDTVDIPNNNFYCLKDFMIFRASPKLNRGDGSSYYQLFLESVKRLQVTSIKQDGANDSWGISPYANV